MILKHMSEKFNADTDQMKHEMPSVINAVLQCYGGDCSDCVEKSSGICAGADSDNWFVRSHSLRENGITALHPSETDIQTMREILLIVLGDKASLTHRHVHGFWKSTEANDKASTPY